MTDQVLIDRALLQELIDDVSDYAESRSFKKVEWHWRTELLEKARALLAAGASEGQAEPVGFAIAMPGSDDGFTMSAFKASDVPVGASLYLHPSAEIAALRERIAGMEKDAQRWRAGVRLKCFPEHSGHDDAARYGESWYMPNCALPDVPEPFVTPEEAIDAAIAKEKQG
ncbi:hypothetical protein [Caballeronia zhejiangensis]|uniref:hypothetical protein n=1 Tax=Caballeronia zhejiangensis TaxID=871203 RepID=UPI00158C1339|nr:hypothetical protein [Caballeronia zhejiangensis]